MSAIASAISVVMGWLPDSRGGRQCAPLFASVRRRGFESLGRFIIFPLPLFTPSYGDEKPPSVRRSLHKGEALCAHHKHNKVNNLFGVGWERNLTWLHLAVTPANNIVPASSGVKDIVHLKRLVDLAEPLGPVRRATPAAFVERQLELTQQIRHLLPRRGMAGTWASAERCVIEIIKRGQSLRKKLAIRRALNEAVDCAKT